MTQANQSAAANRRPAGQTDGSDNHPYNSNTSRTLQTNPRSPEVQRTEMFIAEGQKQ
jgi:hypothetical protein